MSSEKDIDSKFSEIALEMNYIDQKKVDKALVVKKAVFEKARVNMPIDDILIEMGAITSAERTEILQMQKELESKTADAKNPEASKKTRKPSQSNKKDGCTLNIDVSKDKLMASALIDGQVPTSEFNISDVKIMLHSDGILNGIEDDARISSFLNGEFSVGEPWTIAAGTEPVPDAPSKILYHFDTDPMKIGTLNEDGLMDWKNRGQLPQVKEGDLLAEKIPGPKGKEGMDVYGNIIPIPKIRDQRFKCGKGARRSADGMQVHAKVSGMPKLSVSGEISVMPTLHIQGDISLETGHVEFDGHIDVAGAVEKGYRVKGGTLRAREIRDAQLDIEGDINALNGIFGATIRSGGNLKAGHIHNSDIILAGDMAVEKEVFESKIEANGRCLINDGIILSSTISAKMGITAMDIGTEASKSSQLVVGKDQQLEREAESIRKEISSIKADQESLPKRIDRLKKRSDEVNTRLGEVAQEQDKCMVQHRRLQQKVEAGQLKQGDAAAEKLQKTITELKAQQDAYDHDVLQLMDEDESIDQEIAATETAITETATKLQELNARMEMVIEAQKTSCGLAVVKIGGNVFSGTTITGPHSQLILRENLKRLSIVETDKPDNDGVKRWRFDLNPFR
jgi:uncharacterized protein (DUF342 family)